jgi:hypothetical protein
VWHVHGEDVRKFHNPLLADDATEIFKPHGSTGQALHFLKKKPPPVARQKDFF